MKSKNSFDNFFWCINSISWEFVDMTYTLVGQKDYVLEEVSRIEKGQDNVIGYNLEEDSLKDAIIDINTYSLFGDKIIKIFNIDRLEDPKPLLGYLDNPNDNILVLISYKELDNRKKITKVLKEKTEYKELWNYDLSAYIKDNLDGYKMDFLAINLLISHCDSNIKRIKNELEKLKLYKYNDKEITREDVNNLVKKGYDSTIFNLIDEINKRNKERVMGIYKELLLENETEEKILYTIANHYRLLYKIKVKSMSLSDHELIKLYGLHPYRLTKLKEQCNLISGDEILSMLKELSNIDIGVKSGKIDISTGMFLFFEKL